ncbi:MAG: hypothetical protein IT381_10805 [Deltaproteobacteria bacterium]|nr:hypothetical protein [Deltaproteobacteria bacterium]
MKRASVASLQRSAADPAAPDTPALKGKHDRALAELVKVANENALDGDTLARHVSGLPATLDRINEQLATKRKLRLHVYSSDPKRVCVYEPIATVPALSEPVIVAHMLGEALDDDHADDWLLREARPVVSTRAIARTLVDMLIAAAGTPELCPVGIRLQSHLALGGEIDRVYREAVARAGEVPVERLAPLCRRERLRRLAHEELLDRHEKFPFVPALLMSENEVALLERLQDPDKTKGLGGKARSYMNSMARADDELHASVPALTPVVRVLAAEQAYETAVFAAAYAKMSSPGAASGLKVDAIATTPAAAAERCAHFAAYGAAFNKPRFLAQRVARLSGEAWPAEPERSGLIAFLYAQADLAPPKEAIASGPQMQKLWEALAKTPPPKSCLGLTPPPPSGYALDAEASAAIAATLMAE